MKSTKRKVARKKPVRRKAYIEARETPKREFPAHLNTTPAEWRALKRTEWREVEQALARFQYGSAYTPSQAAQYALLKAAHQVTEAIEAPDWIAW